MRCTDPVKTKQEIHSAIDHSFFNTGKQALPPSSSTIDSRTYTLRPSELSQLFTARGRLTLVALTLFMLATLFAGVAHSANVVVTPYVTTAPVGKFLYLTVDVDSAFPAAELSAAHTFVQPAFTNGLSRVNVKGTTPPWTGQIFSLSGEAVILTEGNADSDAFMVKMLCIDEGTGPLYINTEGTEAEVTSQSLGTAANFTQSNALPVTCTAENGSGFASAPGAASPADLTGLTPYAAAAKIYNMFYGAKNSLNQETTHLQSDPSCSVDRISTQVDLSTIIEELGLGVIDKDAKGCTDPNDHGGTSTDHFYRFGPNLLDFTQPVPSNIFKTPKGAMTVEDDFIFIRTIVDDGSTKDGKVGCKKQGNSMDCVKENRLQIDAVTDPNTGTQEFQIQKENGQSSWRSDPNTGTIWTEGFQQNWNNVTPGNTGSQLPTNQENLDTSFNNTGSGDFNQVSWSGSFNQGGLCPGGTPPGFMGIVTISSPVSSAVYSSSDGCFVLLTNSLGMIMSGMDVVPLDSSLVFPWLDCIDLACPAACVDDTWCAAGEFCESGYCAALGPACDAVTTCPQGSICDYSRGACLEVESFFCLSDSDCFGGTCNLGQCSFPASSCLSQADCPAGQGCDSTYTCQDLSCLVDTDCSNFDPTFTCNGSFCSPPGSLDSTCTIHVDCNQGLGCDTSGTCQDQSCLADSDCTNFPGTICDAGTCSATANTCASDADCPAGEGCGGAGTCESLACFDDAGCFIFDPTFTCNGGTCSPPPNTCAVHADCPTGEGCSSAGTCENLFCTGDPDCSIFGPGFTCNGNVGECEEFPNQPPEITSGNALTYTENETVGPIGTVLGFDPDDDRLEYSIVGGADAHHFNINFETGELFIAGQPLDYEARADANGDNNYEIQVQVSDDAIDPLTQTQTITITVLNVDEPPSFIGDATSHTFSENGTLPATKVIGFDWENAPLTISIVGGADAGAFSLELTSTFEPEARELVFNSPPNFEVPADANGDNDYEVQLAVSDGTHSVTRTITVTVTDVDEPPTVIDDTATVEAGLSVQLDLLSNDTDPEGKPLTISGVTQPVEADGTPNGTVTINPDGKSVTFTSDPGATGNPTLTFTYTVTDGTNDPPPATVTVNMLTHQIDLGITKTDSADPYTLPSAEPLVYTLKVTNHDTQWSATAFVTDILPGGISAASAVVVEDNKACTGTGVVICAGITLAPLQTKTIRIEAAINTLLVFDHLGITVNAGNAAYVEGTDDPDPTNDRAIEYTVLNRPLADLAVTITATPNPVLSSGTISYTLTVTNNGPSPAAGVLLDDIPAFETFLVAPPVPSQGSCNPGVPVSCNLGGLAEGAQATVTFQLTMDELQLFAPLGPDTTIIGNIANVTSSTPDQNPDNNVKEIFTEVQLDIDLGIEPLWAAPIDVNEGSTFSFEFDLNNPNGHNASGGTIVISPEGIALDSLGPNILAPTITVNTVQVSGTMDANGNFTFEVGGLSPGKTRVRVDANSTGTGTGQIRTTVNHAGQDGNPANDTAIMEVNLIPMADLAVTVSANPGPVLSSGTISYTLTVTNNGPSDAAGVQLSDLFPSEASLVAPPVPSQGSCNPVPGLLLCNLGGLAVGAQATVTFQLTLDEEQLFAPPAPDTKALSNSAMVTSDTPDHNPDNDTSDVFTDVQLDIDLATEPISASPMDVNEKDPLSFEFYVNNPSPQIANSSSIVVISEGFGISGTGFLIDVTGVTVDTSPAPCTTDATGDFICDVGGLKPGKTLVRVDGQATGTGTGRIRTTVNHAGQDGNPANDTAIMEVNLIPVADLAITKTSSPNPALSDDFIKYTLTVTNNGPSAAAGVQVNDDLPSGTVLLGAPQPSQGDCNATPGPLSVWSATPGPVICNLGGLAPGAQATVYFIIGIDEAAFFTPGGPTTTTITNSAMVSSGTPDPNPDNNTSPPESTEVELNINLDLFGLPTAPIDVKEGEPFTIEFEVYNYSELVANGGSLTLTTDAGLIMINSVTMDGVAVPCNTDATGKTTCDAGGFKTGTTRVRIDGQAIGTGPAQIRATVSHPGLDAKPDNDTGILEFNLIPVVDVGVVKEVDRTVTHFGETVTFTITVTNHDEDQSATNVVLYDDFFDSIISSPFKANASAFSSFLVSQGTCTIGDHAPIPGLPWSLGTYYWCALGTIPPKGQVVATATYVVDIPSPLGMSNKVSVTHAEPDQNPDNDKYEVFLPVAPSADLQVTKVPHADPLIMGEDLLYTITVTNNGPDPAVGFTLTDTAPVAGLKWFDIVEPADAPCALAPSLQNPQGFTCLFNGTLAVGESRVFEAWYETSVEGVFGNMATAFSATHDPFLSNNKDIVLSTVEPLPLIDLGVTKTADRSVAAIGFPLTYTITVTNYGLGVASAVRIWDELPAGTMVSATPATGICRTFPAGDAANPGDPASDLLDCQVGQLGVGASTTVTLVVAPDTLGNLDNTVTIVGPSRVDNNPTNNSATSQVNVTADEDGDGIANAVDNCPTVANPQQTDANGDGFGDLCVSLEAEIFPPPSLGYGVVIDPGATVKEGAVIGDRTTVSDGATVEKNVIVGNNTFVGPDVELKDGAVVGNNVTIGLGAEIDKGAQIGNGVTIGADAEIKDGAIIGDGSVIGDGAKIDEDIVVPPGTVVGPDVELKDGAVVGNNVTIGPGAEIDKGAQIGNGVTIGADAEIKDGAIIGDGSVIGDGAKIDEDIVVPPGTVVPPGAEL